MTSEPSIVDSNSTGDPSRFRPLEELERMLADLPAVPADRGRVALIVRKAEGGRRETPERVELSPQAGVPGDAWGRDPEPEADAQITAIQRDVIDLLANGQPLTLSGDNLILELDLSDANLPTGSRIRLGRALLEVTPLPHDGCRKFRARFGDAALRFVARPEQRHLNLRGIYLRVIEAGEVRVGDPVEVVSRAAVASDGP